MTKRIHPANGLAHRIASALPNWVVVPMNCRVGNDITSFIQLHWFLKPSQ